MRSTLLFCSTLTIISTLFTASAAFAQDTVEELEAGSAPAPVAPPAPEPVAATAPAGVVQEPTASLTFGRAGQLVVGAERLFGVSWESTGIDEGGVETTTSYTSVALLSNRIGGVLGNYSFSRLAGDYFVVDGFSVGAALGYFNVSGHYKREANGTSDEADTGTFSGFVLAPRVGFATMVSPTVGFWPKAGITYVTLSIDDADGNDATSASRAALSAEAPLSITPVPHVGFSVGPTLDYGIAGSNEDTTFDDTTGNTITESVDVSTIAIGLHAGLFVYF